MKLALLGNTLLRTAITRNLVTFPAQIQPFMRRTAGDLPERIVQLYFVRGWSVRNICERYGMSKAMIHKLLAEWRIRAVESGYIQEVEPDCLAALDPEIKAVPPREEKRNHTSEWVSSPHPISEPAEIVYGAPVAMQTPDHSLALSATGRT
jgi:hypothetical protein